MKTTKKKAAPIAHEELCTLQEAAKMLGVNWQTAYRLADSGKIKRFTYGKGMRPRVLVSSVRELMKKAEKAGV